MASTDFTQENDATQELYDCSIDIFVRASKRVHRTGLSIRLRDSRPADARRCFKRTDRSHGELVVCSVNAARITASTSSVLR